MDGCMDSSKTECLWHVIAGKGIKMRTAEATATEQSINYLL